MTEFPVSHLRAGVTTVRDTGATDALSVDVARAVELGVLDGPRVWSIWLGRLLLRER